MIFALVGNQNCGKTTIFNQITNLKQHVGNFPGVTVEYKIGDIPNHQNCQIVDLPGLYSLNTYTHEEVITKDFIYRQTRCYYKCSRCNKFKKKFISNTSVKRNWNSNDNSFKHDG